MKLLFLCSFLVGVGIRIESGDDELRGSTKTQLAAESNGTYANELNNHITGQDHDYYSNYANAQDAGALIAEMDDRSDWGTGGWSSNMDFRFALDQAVDMGCGASSLVTIRSDVNSSSDSLLNSTKVVFKASSNNAFVRWHPEGYLHTKGTVDLTVTINKDFSGSTRWNKTYVFPMWNHLVYAVYVSVGIKYDINMRGHAGFRVTVPMTWDICLSKQGLCGSWLPSFVKTGSISFERWIYVSVQGSAEVSTSLQVEKAQVLTTSAQVLSKLTLNGGSCTQRYDYHIRSKALTGVAWFLNQVVQTVNYITNSCLDEFGEINLGSLLHGTIWQGPC